METYEVDNKTNENSTLQLSDNPFNLPLEVSSFDSDKESFKFIKNVEKLVRSSLEYREWVSYVTESLGHRECALTKENINECSLEVHHHPINLFNICNAVTTDFINKNLKFTTYAIALEVIKLHFQNKVGYMVLLSDIHEKFHNGFQNLPIDSVHGNYQYLIDNYIFDETETLKIQEYCKITLDKVSVGWSKGEYPGLTKNESISMKSVQLPLKKKVESDLLFLPEIELDDESE